MNTFAGTLGQKQTNRHGRRSAADATLSIAARRLRQFGDGCLMVIVFVVPMMSATTQEFGNGVFVLCSLLMGVSWAIEHILHPTQSSSASGAEIIILAAIGLVCLQLMPLSSSVLKAIAPFSSEYLTLWGTDDGRVLGSDAWQTISLTPSLTRSGLILLVGYAIFFLTLLQRLRSIEDVERIVKLIALVAAVMALIGLLQLRGNGKFLWLFEHPFRTAAWPAKGAFSNANHFAHFLALGIGPLIWWWQDSTQQKKQTIRGSVQARGFGVQRSTDAQRRFLGIAIMVVALAGLLSISRGGIVVLAIAGLIGMKTVAGKLSHLFKLAVPVIFFASIGVWIIGAEYLQQKMNRIAEAGSIQELLAGRLALWSAIWEALPSFFAAGSGLGSHAEIYPTWMAEDFGVRFSHAESGYLQVLLELGVAGFAILLAGILLVGTWIWRARKNSNSEIRKLVTILSAGIVASVLHSFIDFVWYIPGCMIVTLTICACLCRCCQLTSEVTTNRSSIRFWPQALAVVMILSTIPFGRLSADVATRDAESEFDWNQYRLHSVAVSDSATYNSMESLDQRLDAIIMHLENCVRVDPADFRAASFLSVMYVRRFERNRQKSGNQITIHEIRSTVRSSPFESAEEIAEWLNRAFGHEASDLYRALAVARKAVQGQPMRGETYLVIAQLGFLAGITEEQEEALIQQAIRLRPHNAAVLFVIGLNEIERGDLDSAMKHWRAAFKNDPAIRPLILNGLAPHLPVEQIIESLNPGADSLWLLFTHYREREQTEQIQTVMDHFRNNFERFAEESNTPRGMHFWRNSFFMFDYDGDADAAMRCLKFAVDRNPTSYELRRIYGLKLLDNGAKEDAVAQLEWCQLRKPDDREIAQVLEDLERGVTYGGNHE